MRDAGSVTLALGIDFELSELPDALAGRPRHLRLMLLYLSKLILSLSLTHAQTVALDATAQQGSSTDLTSQRALA